MAKRKEVRFRRKKHNVNNLKRPEIEKITSELFRLSGNFIVEHHVIVGKKLKDGTYYSRMTENTYQSNKYTDQNELTSYNIEREDYVVFNVATNNEPRTKIFVSYSHISRVRDLFKNAAKWYTDPEYNDVFVYDENGKLIVNEERNDSFLASGLVRGTSMMIIPYVINVKEYNESYQEEGAILFLNSEQNYIVLSRDDVLTIEDNISDLRLYEASLALGLSLNFVIE